MVSLRRWALRPWSTFNSDGYFSKFYHRFGFDDIIQRHNNSKKYHCMNRYLLRRKYSFVYSIQNFRNFVIELIISLMVEIDTGTPNIIDARGQSISRGVYDGVAFANFVAQKFSYLNITSLGNVYVLNGRECGFACADIPSCFSYNLAVSYGINGRMLCELLPSDKYNNSDKFIASQFFHHFSIVVSTSMTASLKSVHFHNFYSVFSRSRKKWD